MPKNTNLQRLKEYFTAGLSPSRAALVGMEVETSFLNADGAPITTEQSQQIFVLLEKRGWMARRTELGFVRIASDRFGNILRYDVGRQNLEAATYPTRSSSVVRTGLSVLGEVYEVAESCGAYPRSEPILETQEDLLFAANTFDAERIATDGREARNLLARMSAVHFTVNVPRDKAVACLDSLGRAVGRYLADYPQDALWREYIATAKAGYREDRYGGPLRFESLAHYCEEIAKHDVVQEKKLVPFERAVELDLTMHVRLVWWHFRLRRYADRLCIEVRPLPRRSDETLAQQLNFVLDTLGL